ncbi:MAG: hypothetical protein CMK76_07410 [Pseudomonadales bacterium]|nr:hypothetical protein [Pseudomonadales bacterium]|tara:strand:+ start:38948 stop:39148 length:201 start_codon:yes stop_codon:yes gene_type:complete
MDTARKAASRCRIYLHPTAACNPAAIEAITSRTRMAIVVGGNRRGAELRHPVSAEDHGPWDGGDAA